jgi:hypothetical protein
MVKTKPPAAVGSGPSLDHPLRATPANCRDGETARFCQTKKLLVDHISCLRALGLGTAVVDVLNGKVELVFVALGAAKFGAAVGQHPAKRDLVLVKKGITRSFSNSAGECPEFCVRRAVSHGFEPSAR